MNAIVRRYVFLAPPANVPATAIQCFKLLHGDNSLSNAVDDIDSLQLIILTLQLIE